MQPEKPTLEELQGRLSTLVQQRDNALNTVVLQGGEIARLNAEIARFKANKSDGQVDEEYRARHTMGAIPILDAGRITTKGYHE